MTSDFPEHIFRSYDIRGNVTDEITPEFVTRVGIAYARRFADRGSATLVIGRDLRDTSERLAESLTEGIRAAGVNVVDIGQVPIPLVYFAIGLWGLDGGIGVTASHRPSDENGLKLRMGEGPFFGDDLQGLKDDVRAVETGVDMKRTGDYQQRDIFEDYFRLANQQLSIDRPMNIVLDVGNGCGTLTAPRLLRELGCDVTVLFEEPDGTFPGRGPDPMDEEAIKPLKQEVTSTDAEIGIAIDADGDRVAVVDHDGDYIQPDEYMIPICRQALDRGPITVVSEVRCSQSIVDDVKSRGGEFYLEACGYPFILAGMDEHDAQIGFETTGHSYFSDPYFKFDDATHSAARILSALADTDETLRDIIDSAPTYYPYDPPRYHCPDDEKAAVVEEVAETYADDVELIRTDGVRAQFEDRWSVLRHSNTGPELVLRWEGRTPEARDSIGEDLMTRLERVMDKHGLPLRPVEH